MRLARAKHGASAAQDAAARMAGQLFWRMRLDAVPGRVRKAGSAVAASAFIRSFKKEPRFWLSLAAVIAALLSSVATFLILSGLTAISFTGYVVVTTLGINAAFVAAIIGIVTFQIVKLLRARKRQAAGAGLHFKLAGVFSLIALVPVVLLAVFAILFMEQSFNAFFSNHVKSLATDSVKAAQFVMRESGQSVQSDMAGIGREIEQNAALFRDDKAAFDRFFSATVSLRAMQAAFVIDSKGNLLSTASSDNAAFKPIDPPAFTRAQEGRILLLSWDADGISALMKLKGFDDAYLYGVRAVNPDVLVFLQGTRARINKFVQLEQLLGQMRFVFAMMYVLLALTLFISAIWIGLAFANRLVTPIRKLIGAAEEVSHGNLDVQLDSGFARDDIGRLGATFKRMTVDLKTQRDDIMSANAELDERRRFIEAVLSGVTAGVIGLDSAGSVTLMNRSARELLRLKEAKILGKPLIAAVPEFGGIIEKARRQGRNKPVLSQVTIVRESGEHNFAVQVTREEAGKAGQGAVVTFDDVTELTVAQRTSAWADVARRIAHEIKNPLTPIQLSAERIRRKYGDSITKDREIFDKCIATIVRHVGDIGRMVDEFSSFARMPNAVFEQQDIREMVKEAVILFQMSRHDIEYKLELPDGPLMALCDRRLLTQAVTNLVKNASEAVEAYQSQNGEAPEKGRVSIRLHAGDHRFVIGVIDNGCGLPKENRHRLVEPYVTTRQKGTGLGLAIVNRITEQHGGVLELDDAPAAEGYTHGAWIKMSIPVSLASGGWGADAEEAKPAGQERESASATPANGGKEGVSHGV